MMWAAGSLGLRSVSASFSGSSWDPVRAEESRIGSRADTHAWSPIQGWGTWIRGGREYLGMQMGRSWASLREWSGGEGDGLHLPDRCWAWACTPGSAVPAAWVSGITVCRVQS